MKSIFLKHGKEDSLKRYHPWIFSGAIHHMSEEPEEGEIVAVYTHKNEYIATGHFQIGSIMVRVLSFENEAIDQKFYERKLTIALDVRKRIGMIGNNNNTYRLVHGEGDNLPGLVIDVYGHTAVMQAHSVGMHKDRKLLALALNRYKLPFVTSVLSVNVSTITSSIIKLSGPNL
jgi:23S rRNA (cytosine1962-C5)-methyltransferase